MFVLFKVGELPRALPYPTGGGGRVCFQFKERKEKLYVVRCILFISVLQHFSPSLQFRGLACQETLSGSWFLMRPISKGLKSFRNQVTKMFVSRNYTFAILPSSWEMYSYFFLASVNLKSTLLLLLLQSTHNSFEYLNASVHLQRAEGESTTDPKTSSRILRARIWIRIQGTSTTRPHIRTSTYAEQLLAAAAAAAAATTTTRMRRDHDILLTLKTNEIVSFWRARAAYEMIW